MAIFRKNKMPMLKSERYYEPEPETTWEKFSKFPIFVSAGLVIVVVVIALIFFFNSTSNALTAFVSASSKVFDSTSFKYEITASENDKTYMEFEGQMEFDLDNQKMESLYHAQYSDYDYDAVIYAKGADAYRGNYYDKKWIVNSYTDRALDFFDFYRDYRKGDFDAGAAVRFTGTNSKFNAQQLEDSVNQIIKELSTPNGFNEVLHQEVITSADGERSIIFNVELEKFFDIVNKYIGSAYASANEYSDFKEKIEANRENLQNAQTVISYTISKDGYLTDITINHTVNDDTYEIKVSLSDFAKAEVEIPKAFFKEADIKVED